MRRAGFCVMFVLSILLVGGLAVGCGGDSSQKENGQQAKSNEAGKGGQAKTDAAAKKAAEQKKDKASARKPELPAPANESQRATVTPSGLPEAQAAPVDSTLSLSIPKIGLSGVSVFDDTSETPLTNGVIHLSGTGFPWQGMDSNTYLAGHRLGYPGAPSDHIFWDLP